MHPSVGENKKVNPSRRHFTFSMGFHLSYMALRDGPDYSDPRGFRQCYSLIKPMGGSSKELYYYDAQISFMITGVDETQWTAYCLVDTHLGSGQGPEAYLVHKQDGPSGGAQLDSEPCWNPREYLLLVLAERIKQTAREWGNIISTLMERLDAYVCGTGNTKLLQANGRVGESLHPYH